ncbi:MAG: methyltransferase domain-containing protein [Polyangia bacterium]
MRAAICAELPLICPACRVRTHAGRELFTLSVEAELVGVAGEIEEGILRCDNPACRRRYPILDGIPILVADLGAFLRGQLDAAIERELRPETAALLALAGPDEAPFAERLAHLSTYLDAHWGDRAEPPPDGPAHTPPFGMRELAERLGARAETKVARAVELGASVGRGVAELARGAALTVGVDLHFGALQRARRLLAGAPLAYARRLTGRHYSPAVARAGELASPNVAWICADALDPPLAPGGFDRVVALNLLDNVHSPLGLLSVLDGLTAPEGELIVASPYSFSSQVVGEEHRFGERDPGGELVRRFRAGDGLEARYQIEDEAELTWWLRRDRRSGHAYAVHYIRARRLRS